MNNGITVNERIIIKKLKYKHFSEGKNVSSLDKNAKHLYLKYI